MKKKLIGLAIIAPLFLSACSFQEVWGNIKDKTLSLFGQKAKEEKDSGTTPGGTTPSGTGTTPGGGDTTPVAQGNYLVQFAANGSDSTSAITDLSKVLEQISSGSNYVQSVTQGDKIFAGASGLKLGNSSTKGSVTFSLNTSTVTETITSITVYSAQFGTDTGSLNVYVNGTNKGQITPSDGGTITLNEKVTSLKFETSAKRAYLVGFSLNYGGFVPGGGSQGTDEFPSSQINTFLASLGSTATISSFSGEAKSFAFESQEGAAVLDIEVEVGSENAAISAFAGDLLSSNNFLEDAADIYGDMHYVSVDSKVDVCAWDGTNASTSAPGHVYVDFTEYVAPISSLSLSEINSFLTTEEFDFNLTQSEIDALNALSNSFKVTTGADSSGYGWYDIVFNGIVATEINDIIKTTLQSAGYTVETTEDGFTWTNEYYYSVTIASSNGVTLLEFY